MVPPQALDEASSRIVLWVTLAGLAPALVLGAGIALLVHPLLGLLLGVVVLAAWALFIRQRVDSATRAVIEPLRAAPLERGGQPRLENLLDSVCAVSGIEEPRVLIAEDRSANAVAVADSSGSTIALTEGLLESLGRVELEAVLASLAARVKSGTARYAATVLALPLPGGLAAKLLHDGLGEQSSVRSDLAAVRLTKYPPGLIAAFGIMEREGTAVSGADPRTAPMWLADPVGANPGADTTDSELDPQPLSLRIAVLQEL